MPQLDLTFFFNASLTVCIGYLTLLFVFEFYIIPVMLENIKFRSKIVEYFNRPRIRKDFQARKRFKEYTEYVERARNLVDTVSK